MPRQFFRFAHSVRCTACNSGPGHWCRTPEGKCCPPHRERSREALRVACSVLKPYTKTQVKPQFETRWEAGK
jgi:hypothetical protein